MNSFKSRDRKDRKGGREGRDGRDSRDGRDGDRRDNKRERFFRRRTCRFCEEKNIKIDYKDAIALRPFISERGRITPRRVTSTCAYHQREITLAIKRARILALLPFSATQQVR